MSLSSGTDRSGGGRRAESEIQALSGKLNLLTEKVDDMEEVLRRR